MRRLHIFILKFPDLYLWPTQYQTSEHSPPSEWYQGFYSLLLSGAIVHRFIVDLCIFYALGLSTLGDTGFFRLQGIKVL